MNCDYCQADYEPYIAAIETAPLGAMAIPCQRDSFFVHFVPTRNKPAVHWMDDKVGLAASSLIGSLTEIVGLRACKAFCDSIGVGSPEALDALSRAAHDINIAIIELETEAEDELLQLLGKKRMAIPKGAENDG